MKIGIDARLWNETGVGRYIRNLVWELEKLDKINEYVLFVQNGFTSQDLRFKNKAWKIIPTGIHWHSLAEQAKFPGILYKENLDLMHFPYFSLPILYAKPFVVTIHDLIITHFSTGKASTLPYPLYLLKRFGYRMVIDHAVKNSQKIIVPLNAIKKDVIKRFDIPEDKLVVTYEGVEKMVNGQWSMAKKEVNSEKYFLYVGNAYPHKNLEFLIDGFIEFRKSINEEVKLILVGKEDYFYKRLSQKLSTQVLDCIEFKHHVDDKELFNLYAHAKAFVSASRMEGFGLPPLEAMSSSCLVVLSAIPSFKEVCKDAGFYFDPTDKSSLKEQLRLVYNLDHKTREQKIVKGLARVKQFSWKEMAQTTKDTYESSVSVRQS